MGTRKKRLFSRIFHFKWFKKTFKGSYRDPFLYLGIISAVLLNLIPLFSNSSLNLFNNKGGISLAALSQVSSQSPQNSGAFSTGKESIAELPDLVLVENSSLKPASPPVTVSSRVFGTFVNGGSEDVKKVVDEYTVAPGDSFPSIAKQFNVSLNTIFWANGLNSHSKARVGQTLIIPPVSGVVYHVKPGDTLSDIARKYKGDQVDIIAFNNLSDEKDIYVGDILIIPNGVMPPSANPNPVPGLPLPNSYFICPIAAPCQISQGLHWYNAVDFSNGQCGISVYAAAAGEVIKVKLTDSTSRSANGGAGNNISILHPNGVVTSYYHLETSLVRQGDHVSQGQTIALVGGQPGMPGAGNSTGCHMHFGVVGAGNPFGR